MSSARDSGPVPGRGAADFVLIGGLAGTPATIEGMAIHVASLDHLIATKERSGRTKDKLMATEHRVLSDEVRRAGET